MSSDKNKARWSINRDRHVPPKSPFWFASYRDADGRRVRRSTATEDKTLAEKLAMEWAELAEAGRAGRLTESRCRAVIAQMYERVIGEPLHFRTAREYLTEWVESKKQETELRAYCKYSQIVHEFLEHIGAKADRLLREITPADIRSWRDALRRKGLSAPTVNHNITILRIPFKAAHNNGYIEINPTNSLRPLQDEAEDVEKDVFRPDQIAALLRASPTEDWKGAILCAYYTGLRLRDVADLQWSTVNLSERTITLRPHKGRKRQPKKKVCIPLHSQFAEWLRKQTRGIGQAPVFPTLAGKAGGGKSGLSTRFRRIMDKAGVKGRLLRQATGEGRSLSSLSFHSLRHSFNSALANAGVGVETRQELTGHSSMEMNKQYTHATVATLRAAVSLLPSIPTKARAR